MIKKCHHDHVGEHIENLEVGSSNEQRNSHSMQSITQDRKSWAHHQDRMICTPSQHKSLRDVQEHGPSDEEHHLEKIRSQKLSLANVKLY